MQGRKRCAFKLEKKNVSNLEFVGFSGYKCQGGTETLRRGGGGCAV